MDIILYFVNNDAKDVKTVTNYYKYDNGKIDKENCKKNNNKCSIIMKQEDTTI